MTNPTFGISFERLSSEPRSVIGADMSVIGLVGTAPAADAEAFPLNVPVLVFSNDTASVTALGSGGTLPDAIEAINAQLGEFQSAARVVIVRVEEGVDVDATITNIVGNSGNKTGIWALPSAGPILGVIPRLIGVPGYTSQQKSGLGNPAVGGQGSGGANGIFALAFTGGTGTGGEGTFTVAGGALTSITITNPGLYTVAPALSFAASAGLTGATGTVGLVKLANPVCAALPPVLDRLLAHAVVDGPATTLQAYTDWRETINSYRVIPLETAVKVGAGAIVKPGSPFVLGIAVRRDFENIGIPSKSWANQPVYGIVGPNRPIDFSLTDGSTEGQQILAGNGGVILRGEAGVESAISSGGYIFVGTDSATDDTDWQFYNVSRMRDYIHLSYLKTLRFFLGKFNLTGQTVQAIHNTMETFMRDLKARYDILGYKVSVPSSGNSPEQLRTGRVQILFQAEEPPVLRKIHIQSGRYLPAFDELLSNLQSQLDQNL